jgi:hypothetical protein
MKSSTLPIISTHSYYLTRLVVAGLPILLLSLAMGCVRDSYHYGISNQHLVPHLPRTPNLITVGGNHPKLDVYEAKWQYPSKVFRKWFPSKDPAANTPPDVLRLKAIQTASDYLDENGLKGVNIDVREYNPTEQWNRLRNNRRIAPFWKYTGGTLNHIGYCVLPGRVFGYDKYNAYTNTLSINSTSPSTSLYQAGYVKKIYDQRYPGTYMAANLLPILPLYRDASISSDVLTYAETKQDWQLEKNMMPELYGRLGGDLVSQATLFVPGSTYLPFYVTPLLSGAGSAVGSLTGKTIARQRENAFLQKIIR